MKKIKIFTLLLFMSCLLIGCSPKITEGKIYNKEYIPESTYSLIVPMIISNGKTSTTVMIPVTRHKDEEYKIFIKNENISECFWTTKEVYDNCEIGMWFKYEKNRDKLSKTETEERK